MQSWVGRDLKAPFVPTPCHRQGCHPSKGIFPPDAEAQGATSHPSVFPESSSPSLCSCSIPWVMPKGITGHRHAAAHAAGSIWAMTDAINSMLAKVCLEGDAFPTAINVIQQLRLPGLLCWCSATSPAWGWGVASTCTQTGDTMAFLLCRTGNRMSQKIKGYLVTGSERRFPSSLLQAGRNPSGVPV